ncbi:hypothetical protein CHUAL_011679 [Chamberlinius hualienensis]
MAASQAFSLRDPDKELLLELYTHLEWQEDTSDLQCVRCGRVPIYHYVSNCNHLFCLNCKGILDPEATSNPWKCDKCQELITHLDQQQWEIEERVYSLRVSCPNKIYGCKHLSALGDIPKHLSRCVDTREAALPREIKPNQNYDILSYQLQNLQDTFNKELAVLKSNCETKWKYFEQSIRNLTTDISSIKEFRTHFDVPEEELIEVTEENTDDGKVKPNNIITALESQNIDSEVLKNIQDQLKNSHSSKRYDQMISEMRLDIRQLQMQLRAMSGPQKQITDTAHSEVLDWIIEVNENKLERREETDSDLFALPGFSFGAKAKLFRLNNVSLWFNIRFLDNNNARIPITSGPLPMFTFIIEDQNGRNDQDILRTVHVNFMKSTEYDKEIFETSSLDYSMITNGNYIKDHRLKVKILIEPPSLTHSFSSNDGTLLWKLRNCANNMQMVTDKLIECIDSPYFYTSIVGYRVQLKLQLIKNLLTARLSFLTGSFDSELTSDFRHQTTVTLTHKQPSKNVVKSVNGQKAHYVSITFENVSQTDIPTYVTNDCLTIKVNIKPL